MIILAIIFGVMGLSCLSFLYYITHKTDPFAVEPSRQEISGYRTAGILFVLASVCAGGSTLVF